MFSTQHRLTSSQDFQRVYSRGRQIKGRSGKLVVLDRGDENPSRFGISVSAKVGNAVVRNKIKRQIRDIMGGCLSQIEHGYDVIYVVWNVDQDYPSLSSELQKMVKMTTGGSSKPNTNTSQPSTHPIKSLFT